LQNQGQAIDGPILPGFLGYNPEITKYEYNPEKAVEILASDGWKLDEEEEILKKEDQELVLILTTVEQTEKIQAATLITEYWNNLGIKTQLQIVSKENIENDIINPRNYQLLLYGEIIGYDPDLFPFWHSSQREHPGVNLANYVNRKADLLLEDARKTNDQTVRSEKYQEFQNILLEDLPAIFLYSPTYTYPVNTKIQGIEINRIAKPYDRFINLADWYLKTKKKFFN